MSELTSKQQAFAERYIIHFNSARAAREAKYSENTAESQGSILLKNPKVQSQIRKLIEEKEGSYDIERKSVLNELAKIAFSDMSEYCSWDNDGIDYIDSKNLLKKHTAAVKKITCKKVDGEKSTTTTVSLELYDKSKALELLGKHLGLFEMFEQEESDNVVRIAFDPTVLAKKNITKEK
jgi:phage terminase small subunit